MARASITHTRAVAVNASVNQAIWFLAGPVMAERLLETLLSTTNVAMVGRLGPASVAAVGLSNQIAFIGTTLAACINVGTTAVVARRVGANNIQEAKLVARQALILGVVLGFVMFGLTLLVAVPVLRLMGAEPDVIAIGMPYLRWKAFSLIFAVITMGSAAILRGAGDTRTPMWVNGSVNIMTIILNYLLIYGSLGFPNLGVMGAGVATAIARALGAIALLGHFLTRRSVLQLSVKEGFRLDRPAIRQITRIGMPAAGERILIRVAQILFTSVILGMGTEAYAAHQIALRIESLTFMPGFGLGVAATAMVGQNLGARQPGRARESGYAAQRLGMIIGGAMGLIFFFFARPVVGLFIPGHPEVIERGAQVLRIIAVVQPALAANLVISGALRGAGDTRFVMAINGSSVWVRVGLAYALVAWAGLGLAGAWLGMALDLLLRSLLLWLRYRTGHWLSLREWAEEAPKAADAAASEDIAVV